MSSRDKIRIAGADELPRESELAKPNQQPPHPFSKLNRAASRNEVVNASMNAARAVYDQIAEEHNKAIGSLYDEFAQYREVSARRIRQIERWSISYQIQRALSTDIKRFRKWLALQVEFWRSSFRRTSTTELERLAREAARVAGDVAPELIDQVELLAMIRSGQAIAMRWTGKVEDLKDGPFAEFYHEGMTARTNGGIPIRDNDGIEEICAVGDLLLLKQGELSVIKAKVDAAQEAAS